MRCGAYLESFESNKGLFGAEIYTESGKILTMVKLKRVSGVKEFTLIGMLIHFFLLSQQIRYYRIYRPYMIGRGMSCRSIIDQ